MTGTVENAVDEQKKQIETHLEALALIASDN